jgi:hypothetical protein
MSDSSGASSLCPDRYQISAPQRLHLDVPARGDIENPVIEAADEDRAHIALVNDGCKLWMLFDSQHGKFDLMSHCGRRIRVVSSDVGEDALDFGDGRCRPTHSHASR